MAQADTSDRLIKTIQLLHRVLFDVSGLDNVAFVVKAAWEDDLRIFGRGVPDATVAHLEAEVSSVKGVLLSESSFKRRYGPNQLKTSRGFRLSNEVQVAIQCRQVPFLQVVIGHTPKDDAQAKEWTTLASQAVREALAEPSELDDQSAEWADKTTEPSRSETADRVEHEPQIVVDTLKGLWPDQNKEFILRVLEMLRRISGAREEGSRPKGDLVIVLEGSGLDDSCADLRWKFGSEDLCPRLVDAKHVAKLLLASGCKNTNWRGADAGSVLISDGARVYGMREGPYPSPALFVAFRGRRYWLRSLGPNSGGRPFKFLDGRYVATRASPMEDMLQLLVPEVLPASEESFRRKLMAAMLTIVEDAQDRHHGCSIILEGEKGAERANQVDGWQSGELLAKSLPLVNPGEQENGKPFRGNIKIAAGLASMDGAIHLNSRGELCGFGCLMDGLSLGSDENRERGARYNSAIRFTKMRQEMLVVTVSEDGPATVFFRGNVRLDGDRLPYRHLQEDELRGQVLG